MANLDQLAVENFREYLRIPSVQPKPDYESCVVYLQKQAKSLGLPIRVYYFFPNKPIVIISWEGKEPHLPSIFLNGHMDVVPVYKEKWNYDPFGAEMDENGNIYARGTQDMKSVSIQYLEAIRRLKQANVTLRRTIHVSFVPDEEIGSVEGMAAFVKSKEFKELHIGFALDEGMASLDDTIALYNGERSRWVMLLHCPGQPGHSSLLLDNTAGEKSKKLLDRFYELREQERKKLKDNPNLTVGDVTSVNMTMMEGGVQTNIIPLEFIMAIDCRIPVTADFEEFEKTLNKWCEESGKDVWIEYEQKRPKVPITKLDETNPYWIALKKAADDMNITLKTQIFPGGTDSRHLRALNIPALGISPMPNTPTLMHNHNEYLNKDVFLRGIKTYCGLITAIANVK